MGIFSDRSLVKGKLSEFVRVLGVTYLELANQKCPMITSKLPLLRQGVYVCIAYDNGDNKTNSRLLNHTLVNN